MKKFIMSNVIFIIYVFGQYPQHLLFYTVHFFFNIRVKFVIIADALITYIFKNGLYTSYSVSNESGCNNH